MEHTSGPWYVGMKPGPIVYGGKGSQVADCRGMLPKQECGYNSRLIAAAPDLLEAIEQILHRLEGPNNMQTVLYSDSLHPTDDDKTIVDYLQEVIEKATGK